MEPPAAQPQANHSSEQYLLPNKNLYSSEIPHIPASLATKALAYNDFRGYGLGRWHPTENVLLVSHRPGTDTTQLFVLPEPKAELIPITQVAGKTNSRDPVNSGCFHPFTGDTIIYKQSIGGNEQVY